MKNPLDKEVIIANAVAAATGVQAHKQGATVFNSIDVGLAWRFWYKNLTMSILLWVVLFFRARGTGEWGYLVAQSVINVAALGITYAKLVAGSGFKQRSLYRVFWPVARHFPNVARFWFYLALLLPIWLAMWFASHHAVGPRW